MSITNVEIWYRTITILWILFIYHVIFGAKKSNMGGGGLSTFIIRARGFVLEGFCPRGFVLEGFCPYADRETCGQTGSNIQPQNTFQNTFCCNNYYAVAQRAIWKQSCQISADYCFATHICRHLSMLLGPSYYPLAIYLAFTQFRDQPRRCYNNIRVGFHAADCFQKNSQMSRPSFWHIFNEVIRNARAT